ncbi:MAG TPA: hypothetical protein VGR90_08780, partial [Acidimicrobiales bacterium]|nr:hypothetical protein [Acidimicrobiales bacterium]
MPFLDGWCWEAHRSEMPVPDDPVRWLPIRRLGALEGARSAAISGLVVEGRAAVVEPSGANDR